MTKVKICGLSTPETITTAIEAGADFIGLVFYPKSSRHVELEVARYLAQSIPDNIKIVGLFVDPNDETLERTLNEVPLTMIQLHGNETPKRASEVKQKFQLPIIKALSISDSDDLEEAMIYEKIADWFLFDARPPVELQAIGPNSKTLPGGNGIAFDWSILTNYQSDTPWMLAGGLTPENIAEALKITSPDAVDVSSGVESTRGVKDADKIRSFIKAVKQA
jgi:phosphoribosylanthranilate isomerase